MISSHVDQIYITEIASGGCIIVGESPGESGGRKCSTVSYSLQLYEWNLQFTIYALNLEYYLMCEGDAILLFVKGFFFVLVLSRRNVPVLIPKMILCRATIRGQIICLDFIMIDVVISP